MWAVSLHDVSTSSRFSIGTCNLTQRLQVAVWGSSKFHFQVAALNWSRYWGQNSYGATHSDVANFQKPLAFYCQVSVNPRGTEADILLNTFRIMLLTPMIYMTASYWLRLEVMSNVSTNLGSPTRISSYYSIQRSGKPHCNHHYHIWGNQGTKARTA